MNRFLGVPARVLLLMLAISSSCSLGQNSTSSSAALAVKIDANEADRKLILQKLNDEGAHKGLKFETADDKFEYQIRFGTDVVIFPGIEGAHARAMATLSDNHGTELMHSFKDSRYTEGRAAHAVAKDIVKWLISHRR